MNTPDRRTDPYPASIESMGESIAELWQEDIISTFYSQPGSMGALHFAGFLAALEARRVFTRLVDHE